MSSSSIQNATPTAGVLRNVLKGRWFELWGWAPDHTRPGELTCWMVQRYDDNNGGYAEAVKGYERLTGHYTQVALVACDMITSKEVTQCTTTAADLPSSTLKRVGVKSGARTSPRREPPKC